MNGRLIIFTRVESVMKEENKIYEKFKQLILTDL